MAEPEVQILTQGQFISTDPETNGFDLSSGTKWIYPENYPRRDYQFSIVQTALYSNTLVCLPTGLGKTFIAAVVMYNFWRWYPRGRVVFLAPTKPLVAQQINACHEIMGIPSEQTVELTGAVNQTKRRQAWTQKRVIFATPQTFQKDLQNDCVPYELIKCVVIDEAHKALGHHSYCEIVRMLNEKSKFFRILALSATPGSKIDHVREVIQNLLISELELRDDSSPDITPYTNQRSMEKIIVNLDKELNAYKERYINIMDPHVRVLVKNQIIQGNTANISKGRIFMIMKQYESRPQKANNHGIIMKTLNVLLTMYHAYELMIKHGLRAFLNFYINHSDKFWFVSELDLQLLLENIKNYIGDFPVIQPLPDGTIPDVPNDLIFGHSKFHKLREIVVEHFKSFSVENKSTRAIIFVEYRDIVNEVYVLLLQARPLIRPQMFVGQAGQKQKEQLLALEDFRNNKVNVLISTSVGEEGLDVGEVDLIVCFDISTSTPTRLVQRMGRTGRKRNGRVVLLLTDGKEVQTLNQAMSKKESLNSKVLQSSNIASSLYQSSPRMVPPNVTPQCFAIFIKAQPKTPKVKNSKTKAPVEKKPRKKKNDIVPLDHDHISQPSTSKSVTNTKPIGSTQASMMKFLQSQKPNKQLPSHNYDSDSGILSQEFQCVKRQQNVGENPYAVIRPNDVKLLTSDSHGLEFLTLCAMKKSEEEMDDSNVIRIDQSWIPFYSPIDVLTDFMVPSLDSLECIKNLALFERSAEDETKSNSDDSMYNLCNDIESNDVNSRESNCFESFPIMESKYVGNKTDSITQKEDEPDYIDDFPIVESKYVKRFDSTKQSTELTDFDFSDSDFDAIDSKCRSSEIPKNIDLEQPKEFQYSSQESRVKTPACVEVDFENILDEDCTESEVSESQDLINNRTDEPNIFDDLLDVSTDDDLFDLPENQADVTVLPCEANNVTLVNSPRLSTKRSASISPCRESPVKKQKIAEMDSSDSECAVVLGTPPKSKERKSFIGCSSEVAKPMDENAYPDSDQDIFDDLDFDTQFSFTGLVEEPCKQQNESEPHGGKTGGIIGEKLQNVISIDEKRQKVPSQHNAVTIDDIKDSTLIFDKDFEFDDVTVLENSEPTKNVAKSNIQIEKAEKEAVQSSKLESIDGCIDNLNIDDWNDDFDFAPVIKNEDNVQNKFSNFFPTKTKVPSQKTRTQESSSSGWITVNEGVSPMKKPLTLNKQNSSSCTSKKSNSPLALNLQNLGAASTCNKKPKPPEKNNVFSVHGVARPNLRLLSLKKNFNDSLSRDKDGFALPPSKANEFAVPKAVDKVCNDKENKLPRWTNHKRKDNSISPRFRKYHSENNLCSKKKKSNSKLRKRIANEFIDEEAEVSSDADTSAGSSEEEDADLENFVSYTQDVSDAVDMKAHYLQTMNKSPIKAGAFVFKDLKNSVPHHEVFSQPMSQVDESYLQDSFCVGDETHVAAHDSDGSSDHSLLEDIEICLENRRAALRRKNQSKFKCLENDRRRRKNRKDLSSSSDTNSSSEDETEALRKQVLEESRFLRNTKN